MKKLLPCWIVVALLLPGTFHGLFAQLDAFLETTLEPSTCRVGQQVRFEVRLYVLDRDRGKLQVGGLAMAGLRERIRNKSFWEEKEDQLPDSLEVLQKGKSTYHTQVLYRSFLFPLHAGEFQFDQMYLEAQRLVINPQATPLDLLTGKDRQLLPLLLVAPEKRLQVLPLPPAPGSDGAQVGTYHMQARLHPEQVQTGEAVILTVDVSGTGNLAMAPEPGFVRPEGFAWYDPQVAFRVEVSGRQALGERTYSFEMTPAYAGTFELGPVRFPYFDPREGHYDTLIQALPPLRVQGPARPELLESPLAGFYRQAMDRARQTPAWYLPLAPAWAVLLSLGAAALLFLTLMRAGNKN